MLKLDLAFDPGEHVVNKKAVSIFTLERPFCLLISAQKEFITPRSNDERLETRFACHAQEGIE